MNELVILEEIEETIVCLSISLSTTVFYVEETRGDDCRYSLCLSFSLSNTVFSVDYVVALSLVRNPGEGRVV